METPDYGIAFKCRNCGAIQIASATYSRQDSGPVYQLTLTNPAWVMMQLFNDSHVGPVVFHAVVAPSESGS